MNAPFCAPVLIAGITLVPVHINCVLSVIGPTIGGDHGHYAKGIDHDILRWLLVQHYPEAAK